MNKPKQVFHQSSNSYLKFGGKEDTRHMIILNFFLRNKIRFKPNTDYIVTKLINRFFK